MIEVTCENIYYTKKRKKKRKRLKRFMVFFIIFSILFSHYKFIVSPHLINIISDELISISRSSVNSAILVSLDYNLNYSDLVNVEKNSSGEITLMSANTYKVNLIAREITENTKIYLNNKINKGIKVPLCSFLGLGIFSGFGPNVHIKTASISSVETEFKSLFESSGINQTLHSIYVNVAITLGINIPLNKEEIKLTTPVMIGESVVVGKVPDFYLGNDIFR